MADEVQAEIFIPSPFVKFIYHGQRQVRRSFSQYLQFMFGNMPFLEDYKFIDNQRKESKIRIFSVYPQEEIIHPLIVVYSTPTRNTPVSIGDISRFQEDDESGWLVMTGEHSYDVSLTVESFGKEECEDILDRIYILFSINETRKQFAKTYSIVINPAEGIYTQNLSEENIPNTDQKLFKGDLRMSVSNQWEVHLSKQDYDIINSEYVIPDYVE